MTTFNKKGTFLDYILTQKQKICQMKIICIFHNIRYDHDRYQITSMLISSVNVLQLAVNAQCS